MKNHAEFVEDISVRGMLHGLTLRSPVARGVLRLIKCPKLPNSYYLITAEHIPGKNKLADFSLPVLADKNLSYIGQPVAILAGPDESKLEELASGIEIMVEETPPVFSAPGDPDYTIVTREISSGAASQVPAEISSGQKPSAERPPADEASSPPGVPGTSGKNISGTYTTGIQEHWYAEAHGALVVPSSPLFFHGAGARAKKAEASDSRAEHSASEKDNDKKDSETFTVYTATQWPFHVKRSVAAVLGWDDKRIDLVPAFLTAHLDGKIWYPSLVACHAALAAWITRSPVKIMYTREEDFLFSPKRNRAEIKISSTLGEKGEISDSAIQVSLDLGAEGIFEDELMDHTCLGSLGVYNHRAFRIKGEGLRTNIPPQGPLAGFGLSQGFFAAERHASRIADSLGQDPAQWRKNNFLAKDQKLAAGTTLKNHVPLAELIDAAAAMCDYYRKWAAYELLRSRLLEKKWDFGTEPLRGIGIAAAYQGSGFLYHTESGNSNCAVELVLEKDGSLEIKTNLVVSGAGHLDTWRNLAQEILGTDPALIRLTNTGAVPDAGPGTLSRNIGVLTGLVERCCVTIRKQRFRRPLPITVKRSAKPVMAPGWVPGKNIDPEAFAQPSWGATVVEIEIDPVSLLPLVRGIWLVVDGGKILSQRRARRTLATGIIGALGWTCREQVYYDKGKIPPELFRAYDIPAPAEIPPISVDFIWNDTASPKGIGDLPFCCVPAAYVQAVSQAMDHPFEKIPLDARDIWSAAKLKETGGAQ